MFLDKLTKLAAVFAQQNQQQPQQPQQPQQLSGNKLARGLGLGSLGSMAGSAVGAAGALGSAAALRHSLKNETPMSTEEIDALRRQMRTTTLPFAEPPDVTNYKLRNANPFGRLENIGTPMPNASELSMYVPAQKSDTPVSLRYLRNPPTEGVLYRTSSPAIGELITTKDIPEMTMGNLSSIANAHEYGHKNSIFKKLPKPAKNAFFKLYNNRTKTVALPGLSGAVRQAYKEETGHDNLGLRLADYGSRAAAMAPLLEEGQASVQGIYNATKALGPKWGLRAAKTFLPAFGTYAALPIGGMIAAPWAVHKLYDIRRRHEANKQNAAE